MLDKSQKLASIILAAGSGTRMKSALPKVLHPICGKPIVLYVIEAVNELAPYKSLIVLGHETDLVKSHLPEKCPEIVIQKQRQGTAHAVLQAKEALKNFDGDVLIVCGDTPLIKSETLGSLLKAHRQSGADVTFLTSKVNDPTGYGRIVRKSGGGFEKIVEQADATDEQKKINEINSGFYVFTSKGLFESLNKISKENNQGEYYLTDVLAILNNTGAKVETLDAPIEEIMGINSRIELSSAIKIMQQRINNYHMLNGVTIVDPKTTYIDDGVKIGSDTTILPNTVIAGNCIIGANSTIGPFSHLRSGTIIEEKAKIGAYSEIKNSVIGQGSKVPHLSYIGDSKIGKNVNIGAGTITCNYDGRQKHQTEIEDGAFIGSDTMLVAPVKVGKEATIGAGSVITKDVPPKALGIERSPQKIIATYKERKTKN